MRTLLLFVLSVFLVVAVVGAGLAQGSGSQEQALISRKVIRGVRAGVDDLARLGVVEDYDELCAVLLGLGDEAKEHEKFRKRWGRDLERGKDKNNRKAQARVAAGLKKQVLGLEKVLAGMQDSDRRGRLAALILRMDWGSDMAHGEIGHVQHGGVWMTDKVKQWTQQEARVAEWVRDAHRLPIEVVHGPSKIPFLVERYGVAAHCVSFQGFRLNGPNPPERLERMLRESMRAVALSNALMGGKLEVPKFDKPDELVLLADKDEFMAAYRASRKGGYLSGIAPRNQKMPDIRSFPDTRGWRYSNWRPEADVQALILWDLKNQWMGDHAQACFIAGQLNWVCLQYFGTSMPSVLWKVAGKEAGGRTTVKAKREDALWRSASRSLFGCRAWLKARMQAGAKFPYLRSIKKELGMVNGDRLLKATLVNEYLQMTGQLRHLVDQTREKTDRASSIETAMGISLLEFEDEWSAWFMQADAGGQGLVQRCGSRGAKETGATPSAQLFLTTLQGFRDEALHEPAPWAERVELFSDLSKAAVLHAQYLSLNPEQGEAWPDAHEEYADRPGFSAAGSWAGGHSVIHFTPDPVKALNGWMATFYHRIPLLTPGLFGVGWGVDGRVSVADIGSLVVPYWGECWVLWPADNANKVPLAFQPEIPNPVPGEDQAQWGYPITLQVYKGLGDGEQIMEMALYLGENTESDPIDCHFLTPANPAFLKLAPADTYCLIPHKHLSPGESYTVLVHCEQTGASKTYHFKTGR